MIRFIIKRHMDNWRTVGTSTFETFDVDVPELEAAPDLMDDVAGQLL